jgi:hypothetical protein
MHTEFNMGKSRPLWLCIEATTMKRKYLMAVVSAGLFLAAYGALPADAAFINVSGSLTTDTTWTSDNVYT